MYCPWVHYTITIKQTCYNYALNIIVLVSSTLFQTYDITLCDTSCDNSHMPLHCPKEKRKRKSNQIKILEFKYTMT